MVIFFFINKYLDQITRTYLIIISEGNVVESIYLAASLKIIYCLQLVA